MKGSAIRLTVVTALSLAWLFAAWNVNALGRRDRDLAQAQKIEVSGRVRLVGSSPMTSLVITGEGREWFVEPGEQDKLMHLQQQTITVRATEYYQDRFFANGSPAGRHYYLKNITIINPMSRE